MIEILILTNIIDRDNVMKTNIKMIVGMIVDFVMAIIIRITASKVVKWPLKNAMNFKKSKGSQPFTCIVH